MSSDLHVCAEACAPHYEISKCKVSHLHLCGAYHLRVAAWDLKRKWFSLHLPQAGCVLAREGQEKEKGFMSFSRIARKSPGHRVLPWCEAADVGVGVAPCWGGLCREPGSGQGAQRSLGTPIYIYRGMCVYIYMVHECICGFTGVAVRGRFAAAGPLLPALRSWDRARLIRLGGH